MNLQELYETVAFEAGVNDLDTIVGWIDTTVGEQLDSLSALTKFDELFRANQPCSPAVGGNGLYVLPLNIQHLDLTSVRYAHEGDDVRSYVLRNASVLTTPNSGRPRYVFKSTASKLQVYPYGGIGSTDTIKINFWVKPSSLIPTDPLDPLPLDVMWETLKKELVQRATAIAGDPKRFQMATSLAKQAHGRSFGVTQLPGMNG